MTQDTDRVSTKMSQKRADRWDRIVDAAELCFAKSGFHGTGISTIAKACGISVGHLYHYVENKEALIEAIIRREFERHLQRLDELAVGEPVDILNELVEKVVDSILNETDPFRTVLIFETLAEAQRNPKVAEILQDYDARMRVRFCDILRRSGVPSPEVKTEIIFTIFGGLPVRALRHPEQKRGIIVETMVPVLRQLLQPASGMSQPDCA